MAHQLRHMLKPITGHKDDKELYIGGKSVE